LSCLLMQLYTNTGNWLEPTPSLVKEPGVTHRELQTHTLALPAHTLGLLGFALDPVSRTYVAFFYLSAHATSVLACKKNLEYQLRHSVEEVKRVKALTKAAVSGHMGACP